MKKLIAILALMIVFAACTKEKHIPDTSEISMMRVKQQLNQQVSPELAGLIDYDKAILTSLRRDSVEMLRLPFKNIPIANKFILLKIGAGSMIETGRIVTINKTGNTLKNGSAANPTKEEITTEGIFNGHLLIQHLDEMVLFSAPIKNGYIMERDNDPFTRSQEMAIHIIPQEQEPRYVILPAVVVTAHSQIKSVSYSDWYNLDIILAPYAFQNYGGSSGYYSSADGGYGGGRGSSGSSSPTSAYQDVPIVVDFEGDHIMQIDIDTYLKCFDQVPDEGAICSIEILTDLPVDGEPMTGFNVHTRSPGHTFLQIRKQNGAQIASQNIGFYPKNAFKTLMTTAPIQGIFADNRRHEFNAALKMELSAPQLKQLTDYISQLSKRVLYDFDDYNCTDFALEVFNFTRSSNPLEIPRMNIPGTMNPAGSNTPQGLYLKLYEMKNTSSESNNVTIPGEKGYVANSTGPCN